MRRGVYHAKAEKHPRGRDASCYNLSVLHQPHHGVGISDDVTVSKSPCSIRETDPIARDFVKYRENSILVENGK